MIGWKCLPGILYQTEGEGKRTRQRRQKERVRGKALRREGNGVSNKIDTLEKNILCECEIDYRDDQECCS